MKVYWDSGALVETVADAELKARLSAEGGFTRQHALSEVFSTLSGKLHFRMLPKDAAKVVRAISEKLEFIALTEKEILSALDNAQPAGVRGGAVHDYLHALAAEKSGATELLTVDKNDFNGLVEGLTITQV